MQMHLPAALLVLLALPQAAPPSDKDADAALKKLKADFAGVSLDKKPGLVAEALVACPHEKVFKAVGDVLVKEPDSVRIPVAQILAAHDHPASAETLAGALGPNLRRVDVAHALLDALGELGWQSACPPLHELLRRVDPDTLELYPRLLAALAKLGSPHSIEPVCELLAKAEQTKKEPWPNERRILKAGEDALQALSGMQFGRSADYKTWWRTHQEVMKSRAIRTFWIRSTGERVVLTPPERVPKDALLVSIRITDPPAEAPKKKPR
jgi:hypothetical protein